MSAPRDMRNASIRDLFTAEVNENATRLESGLVELESSADATQIWRSLMRAAHSIKGAARMVNVSPAVEVAHAMESCFVAGQKGEAPRNRALVDLMLRGKDLLVAIANAPEDEVINDERDDDIADFTRVCRKLRAPAPATANGPPAADVPNAPPAAAITAAAEATATSTDDAPEPATPHVAPIPEAAAPRAVTQPEPTPAPEIEPPPTPRKLSRPAPESATIETAIAPAASAKAAEAEHADARVLRVTADHVDRLLGLSGQSLVNAGRLHTLAEGMRRLKRMQRQVTVLIERAHEERDEKRRTELLAEARAKSKEVQHFLGDRMGELDRYDREAVDLSQRLYRRAQACRMQPFGDGVQHFPRMVRDIARALGKEARLEIAGHATEVDRDILDQLEAPLTHLVRNALDHGLESPAERKAAGKSTLGLLRLEARHAAGKLIVSLSDDGRGIDPEIVRATVVKRGLAVAATAARLSTTELLHFLFLPGFSLRSEVTEYSGRGVGLDVVQHMLKQVRGDVRVVSEPGHGARFDLKLPLALSVLRTLLVEIAGEPYAFPLGRIRRTLRVQREEVIEVEGRPCFMWDDQAVALVGAWELLQKPRPGQSPAIGLPVVLFELDDRPYALAVDRFLGERELVVQPLQRFLGKVPNIQATALLEDGAPALIFDVDDIARTLARMGDSGRWMTVEARLTEEPAQLVKAKRILVVDDSLTVRELERKVLAGAGYEVQTAVDGMEGWNVAREGGFDLILTDVDMPRMDGIEFTGLLKKHPRLGHVPVMIVSYKDRPEDRQRGLEVGADYYLAKSRFDDATLLSAVADLIGPPSTPSTPRA